MGCSGGSSGIAMSYVGVATILSRIDCNNWLIDWLV